MFKKNTKQTSLPLIKSLPIYLDLFLPFQLKPKTQFLILDLIVDEETLHRAFYIVEFHESDYSNRTNTTVPEDVRHIATYLERNYLAKAPPRKPVCADLKSGRHRKKNKAQDPDDFPYNDYKWPEVWWHWGVYERWTRHWNSFRRNTTRVQEVLQFEAS